MSDERSHKCKYSNGWWKGTLPLWMVVILVGILGFFMRREIQDNDIQHNERHKENQDLKIEFIDMRVRIAVMEQSIKDQKVILERIETQMKPLWRP